MANTLAPGRIDIVVFPNGGWEKIGQLQSEPAIPFDNIMPNILYFVEDKQNLPRPEKFTGYYSEKSNHIIINWAPYAGEIPVQETDLFTLNSGMDEFMQLTNSIEEQTNE